MARGGGFIGPPPGAKPHEFVLGSRPPSLRSPAVPQIKPNGANTTMYGKMPIGNPKGASFGDTGKDQGY